MIFLQTEDEPEPEEPMETNSSGDEDDGAKEGNDPNFYPEDHGNHNTYKNFISECLKDNLSSDRMCAIFNSLLVDLKIKDPNMYVSSFKMWNDRVKLIKVKLDFDF